MAQPQPSHFLGGMEIEGAGLSEDPVWTVSSHFPLGLNTELVLGPSGRAGAVALMDRKKQEAFHHLQGARVEGG